MIFKKIITLKKQDIWDAENIYHLKTGNERISKLLYHYDIYKKILNLDGEVIECGVFKGISLARFLTFRNYLESQNTRKIYAFDVFGKFPKPNNKFDRRFLKAWEKDAGNGISNKVLNQLLKKKNFYNYKLIKGQVQKTIPKFIKENPKLKISLLHLDMDIYEPTKFVLNNLYSKVVRGGIILIDDYKTVHGATKAVNEFLKKNIRLKIKKLNHKSVPWFIVKK